MIAWCLANPQLALVVASFVAYVVLSILGAALPIDNRVGQLFRQWAGDIQNKNLKASPPEVKS